MDAVATLAQYSVLSILSTQYSVATLAAAKLESIKFHHEELTRLTSQIDRQEKEISICSLFKCGPIYCNSAFSHLHFLGKPTNMETRGSV